MERPAVSDDAAEHESLAVKHLTVVGELLELIEAIDRRVPQVHRAGEAAIARDAASLKARALSRIDELECLGMHIREL